MTPTTATPTIAETRAHLRDRLDAILAVRGLPGTGATTGARKAVTHLVAQRMAEVTGLDDLVVTQPGSSLFVLRGDHGRRTKVQVLIGRSACNATGEGADALLAQLLTVMAEPAVAEALVAHQLDAASWGADRRLSDVVDLTALSKAEQQLVATWRQMSHDCGDHDVVAAIDSLRPGFDGSPAELLQAVIALTHEDVT